MTHTISSKLDSNRRIIADEEGRVSFVFPPFGANRPVVFEPPRFVIDGRPVDTPFQMKILLYDDSAEIESSLEGLFVRIKHDFHPIHDVPTRSIVVRNEANDPNSQVDLELWFRMPDNGEYAVVSSSDNLAMTYPDDSSSSRTPFVSTVPQRITFEQSLRELVRTRQVNAIVIHKQEHPFVEAPEGWEKLRRSFRPTASSNSTVVDGSPSYRLAANRLGPGESLLLRVPHWSLRTLRDSGGFSGIGYVVHKDDRIAATSCASIPTYLGRSDSVVDFALGLLSPIEFYDEPTVASVGSSVDRLATETPTQIVYVVLPSDFDKAESPALHNAVADRSAPVVITVPPVPAAFLPHKLRQAVTELLGAAALAGTDVPKHIIAMDPGISAALLGAALTPGRLLVPSLDAQEVTVIAENIGCRRVSIVGGPPEVGDSIRIISDQFDYGIADAVIEHFEDAEAASHAGVIEGTWRFAARRCIANAFLSVFLVGDYGLLKSLFEQAAGSYRLSGQSPPDGIAQGSDVDKLLHLAWARPELFVQSVSYASAGPTSLVVAILDSNRWHESVIGALYARSKRLPALFFQLPTDSAKKTRQKIADFDEIVGCDNSSDIGASMVDFKLEWVPDDLVSTVLRVSRKCITLFAPRADTPWELGSWDFSGDGPYWLAQEFDIGRMSGAAGVDASAIVYRTVDEAQQPMSSLGKALYAWDEDVDGILGDVLERQIGDALRSGLRVDVLLPPTRLSAVLEKWGDASELEIRDACKNAKILSLLATGEYSLVNLTGHGSVDSIGSAELSVSRETLSASDIPAIKGYPIVVLNCCWAGRAGYDEMLSVNNGLAVSLFKAGAFQVIAPIYPVSGVSAAHINSLLLDYGLTRSAARVCRRAKLARASGWESDGAIEDMWWITYGDPSVSKFFEFDGLWEIEDAIEKLPKMFPNLKHVPAADVDWIMDLSKRQVRVGFEVAQRWGAAASASMISRQSSFGDLARQVLARSENAISEAAGNVDALIERAERFYDAVRKEAAARND